MFSVSQGCILLTYCGLSCPSIIAYASVFSMMFKVFLSRHSTFFHLHKYHIKNTLCAQFDEALELFDI